MGDQKSNVYLLSYAFNQDYTCFIAGTTQGFRVFTLNPVAEIYRRESNAGGTTNQNNGNANGDSATALLQGTGSQPVQQNMMNSVSNACALCAMLFKTNIFPLVRCVEGRVNSNRVQIWDDNRGSMVGELSNRHEVRGIALRRDLIVMVCEYSIYVYTTDILRLILHVGTSCNLRGLCALSPKDRMFVLACPGQTAGTVRVQYGIVEDQQLTGGKNSHVFTAHQSTLAALTINQSGTLVATASEQGTVVRVFRAADGQVLHELRRGSSPCCVSCLTFRSDDRFLAVASSSPTVHIFKLEQDEQEKELFWNNMERTLKNTEILREKTEGNSNGDSNNPSSPTNAVSNPGIMGSSSIGLGVVDSLPEGLKNVATTVLDRVGQTLKYLESESYLEREKLNEAIKGSIPRYFLATRSYCQFRCPDVPPVTEELNSNYVGASAYGGNYGGYTNQAFHHGSNYDFQKFPDLRAQHSSIRGPLVCFGPPDSGMFYVLHFNGFIYELKILHQSLDGKGGVNESKGGVMGNAVGSTAAAVGNNVTLKVNNAVGTAVPLAKDKLNNIIGAVRNSSAMTSIQERLGFGQSAGGGDTDDAQDGNVGGNTTFAAAPSTTANNPATSSNTNNNNSAVGSGNSAAAAGAGNNEIVVPESRCGTQLIQAQTWFATRPGFQMHKQTVTPEEESDWQLI